MNQQDIRKKINSFFNYISVILVFFSKVTSSFYERKKKGKQLYENKSNILTLNELLQNNELFKIEDITQVYSLGFTTYKPATVKIIKEAIDFESYYKLNFLELYLDTYVDDEGYEDFGDTLDLFCLETIDKCVFLIAIMSKTSEWRLSNVSFKQEVIFLEAIQNFKLSMVGGVSKVCDKLPPPSIFD